MNKLITIIGSSGVGKTALVQALTKKFQFETALEQHLERPFQALAKEDARYILPNQMDYLLLRAEQEKQLRNCQKIGLNGRRPRSGLPRIYRPLSQPQPAQPNEFDLCRRFYQLTRELLPLQGLIVRLRADQGQWQAACPAGSVSTSPVRKKQPCLIPFWTNGWRPYPPAAFWKWTSRTKTKTTPKALTSSLIQSDKSSDPEASMKSQDIVPVVLSIVVIVLVAVL